MNFNFSNLDKTYKFKDVLPITTCIYSIENVNNNKVYIGLTKDLRNRISKHFSLLNLNKHPNKYLQKDFNKLGEELFIISIKRNLNNISLDEEKYWIDKYQRQNLSYNYTKEEKNKCQSWNWKDYPDSKERMKMNVSKTKRKKHAFEQYTREKKLIKVWDSVSDIIEVNPNYKWQNIYSVCNGYKKTYMGFIWKKILKI